jgi:hypothetical protein
LPHRYVDEVWEDALSIEAHRCAGVRVVR